MLINGKRALAYIVTIDEIKPIDGYDRVEYARTNGWWVVVSKNDALKVGDRCVYFETDSRVPDDDERFKFLEKKNYKIKAQKMCKVYSQGLLMPLCYFPELDGLDVDTDVTEKLKVTYAVDEDNIRKSNSIKEIKYNSMKNHHSKLFKTKPIKYLMRYEFGRKILFAIFGSKKDVPLKFPDFIRKTDEERVENQPWRCEDKKTYVITEKLDGSSATYVLQRIGKSKFEFYVCSRNIRLSDKDTSNIYWEMATKYNIREMLQKYLDEHKSCKWVCIQGETVGSVQGNPLKLKENDLYLFNFITSEMGRVGSFEGQEIARNMGMKWCPIIGIGTLPNDMEDIKELADGMSIINPNVMREGLVYRSLDGTDSFKNVSRKYQLKKKG